MLDHRFHFWPDDNHYLPKMNVPWKWYLNNHANKYLLIFFAIILKLQCVDAHYFFNLFTFVSYRGCNRIGNLVFLLEQSWLLRFQRY